MPDSLVVLCRGPRNEELRLVVCDSALLVVELDHGWVWDALKAPIWRSDFETKDPQRNFWTIRCVKNQKQGGMPHIFLNRVWTILESTLEEQLQAWQIHICLQNLGSASWMHVYGSPKHGWDFISGRDQPRPVPCDAAQHRRIWTPAVSGSM